MVDTPEVQTPSLILPEGGEHPSPRYGGVRLKRTVSLSNQPRRPPTISTKSGEPEDQPQNQSEVPSPPPLPFSCS